MTQLFEIGNSLFREKKFADAFFVYYYLQNENPNFHWYKNNIDFVAAKFDKNAFSRIRNAKNKKLHLINALIKNAYFDEAQKFMESNSEISPLPDALLFKANMEETKLSENWFVFTNKYLSLYNVKEIQANSILDQKNVLRNLESKSNLDPLLPQEPLVTVMMSCYNSQETIDYALNSICNQTYKNLEIFVVDDFSTDSSVQIIKKIMANDSRIKLFKNQENRGTYWSRNRAFESASGKYFTILDSDDYALPDRIEIQVNHLERNASAVGVLSNWLRINETGEFVFKFFSEGHLHEAVATLMIRTVDARSKIGYWDSVKFAADTEYIFRLRKFFGKESIIKIDSPTVFSLFHANSLTQHKTHGISEEFGLSPVRKEYRKAWQSWHAKTNKLYISHPLIERPFSAPTDML